MKCNVDIRKNLYALSCSQVVRHMHVYVREKCLRLFIDMSVMEESKTYSKSFSIDISWSLKCAREMCEKMFDCFRPFLVHIHLKKDGRFFRLVYLMWKKKTEELLFFFLEIEECKKNVRNAFRLHSRFCRSDQVHQELVMTEDLSENWTSTFSILQQRSFCNMVPDFLLTVFTYRVSLFSEQGPINGHCPFPNFIAYRYRNLTFSRHSSFIVFCSTGNVVEPRHK